MQRELNYDIKGSEGKKRRSSIGRAVQAPKIFNNEGNLFQGGGGGHEPKNTLIEKLNNEIKLHNIKYQRHFYV